MFSCEIILMSMVCRWCIYVYFMRNGGHFYVVFLRWLCDGNVQIAYYIYFYTDRKYWGMNYRKVGVGGGLCSQHIGSIKISTHYVCNSSAISDRIPVSQTNTVVAKKYPYFRSTNNLQCIFGIT